VLAQFPDQRAKLVERPELVPNAVDELLRFQSPSHANARVATEDVNWYGRVVPEGSVILLLPASAGRDRRQYTDPDTFDVERQFERHLAFGFGIHYCIGAALARLEGRIIIEEVTKRLPEWDVDWDNAEVIHAGSAVRGYTKLPVTF
jgi:cytochrome P450